MTIQNGGRKIEFKVEDGKVFLVIEHLVWDEWREQMKVDVTEEVSVAVNELKPKKEKPKAKAKAKAKTE